MPLDLARYDRIRLSHRPKGQLVMANGLLWPNFSLPPRVKIHFEGVERIPNAPVIFAMNHTDRYNYWPFQYKLYRTCNRFTATWVKGKYYENAGVGMFMEWMNNIPTVSLGYILTHDYLHTVGGRPTSEVYRAVRNAVTAQAADPKASVELSDSNVPEKLLSQARTILGHAYDPKCESYPQTIVRLFEKMRERFTALNQQAFDKRIDVLVFPQGTRSIRLTAGHIGVAQLALHYRKPIVPIGCNGSDRVYPGSNPFAKGGSIVYRVGKPILYEDMAPFYVAEPFEPFRLHVAGEQRERFQGLADHVMDRINDLLDPEYQYSSSRQGPLVQGSERFV